MSGSFPLLLSSYWCEYRFSFLWSQYLGVGLLGPMGKCSSNIIRKSQPVFQNGCNYFALPPALYENHIRFLWGFLVIPVGV